MGHKIGCFGERREENDMSVILKKDLPAGRESFEKWTLAAREAALRTVQEGGQETGRQTAWKADTEAAAAEAGEANVGKKTDAKENLRLNIFPFEDDRKTTGLAVRYSLHLLEQAACGDGIEVRVAPWGAVTVCDGPKSDPHNLTPPDVIELEPDVWLRLASGITSWEEEKAAGNISAVGHRDDLSPFLPLKQF